MHPARFLWPFRLGRFQAILWYWIEPLHNISKCLTTYLVRQWQNTKTLFSQPHEKRISICRIQSCLTDQPCLCLCFGFSQIILMLPFLLMTLHLSQIGFTDDLTFIGILLSRITSLGHNLRPSVTRAEKSDNQYNRRSPNMQVIFVDFLPNFFNIFYYIFILKYELKISGNSSSSNFRITFSSPSRTVNVLFVILIWPFGVRRFTVLLVRKMISGFSSI